VLRRNAQRTYGDYKWLSPVNDLPDKLERVSYKARRDCCLIVIAIHINFNQRRNAMFKRNDRVFAIQHSKHQQHQNPDVSENRVPRFASTVELNDEELDQVSGGRCIGPDWIPK
jgi:bacteriocin-like protein